MTDDFVVYHTDTPRGNAQGLGNHIMIFNAAYSYCLDNSLPFAVDIDAHPVFRNMALPKLRTPQKKHYMITHLTDIRTNSLPFQIHSGEGSPDTNGASIISYAHNIQRIKDALNVPDVSIDGCVLHYRLFNQAPQCNVGLPYYMNALKHIESSTVYIMYGFDNYDIKAEQTIWNIRYLIERLTKIYPNKKFIDIQTVSEYKRDDPKEECALHWYLCVNAPELITANSTFSFSAAIFRGARRTIMPKYAQCYQNFNVNDYKKILKDVQFIPRNVVVSAWIDTESMETDGRKHRMSYIQEFIERVNNADIVIITNNPGFFKEHRISDLSHVRVISVPLEHLYGYAFYDRWKEQSLSDPSNERLSAERLTVWTSKIWCMLIASRVLKQSYDRIAWIDIEVFRISEIGKHSLGIFPVLERYMLPRVHMHSFCSVGTFLRESMYYHTNVGSFILCPSPKYVSSLFSLIDTILRLPGLFIPHDEELNALAMDCVGDFFNISLDKGIGVGKEPGWHHWYFDYSEPIAEFVNNIYADINIRDPRIETSHLRLLADAIKNKST